MGKTKEAYEKLLDEFYEIEEDFRLTPPSVSPEFLNEHNETIVFEELNDEEQEKLKETMGNEFRHAKNHFTKNKDPKWNTTLCFDYYCPWIFILSTA